MSRALAPPGEPRRIAYLYLLPGFVVFALFVLAPLAHSAWLSLFEWDGVTAGTWVGLENYKAIVSDADLRAAFLHALILVVFYAALPIAIGLLLAAAMSRTRVRGLAAFRTILFLPQVIALVVVAVMWRMIYAPSDGLINKGLGLVGIGPQNWLGSFSLALPSVGLIGTWVMYGLAMVLFTAGVQKIPQSLYDAARMDGAGPVREFFAVTLPGLRNEIAVAAHADHDPGAALVRPRVHHDRRRARRRDLGAGVRGLQPRVQGRRRRHRVGDRRLRGGADLRAHRADQPDRRAGGRAVIDRREQTLTYVLLGVFSLIALVPIAGIVLTALQTPGEAATFGEPAGLHFANFANAWDEGHFSQYLRSSVIVSVTVVAASSLLSILAGYAFGMMRFRGDSALFYLFLLGLMVPLESTIVPLYYDFRDLGLTDTYAALILPQVGVSVAFGTFWMRAFFRSVPRSLVEAARLDGSSSWSTLWRVILPFGRPAVLTMMVLIFMWTWNEFLLALVMVSDEDLRTAPLGLAFFQGRNTTDFALLAAGSVIVATPVVVLYVFLQRHFIRGMLSGAVKG